MSTLDAMLEELAVSGDAEFTVQPFDARYEAVVTVYATTEGDKPERKYRAVDRSARTALEKALKAAQEAWL